MEREQYVVRLAHEQREALRHVVRGGKNPARRVARARVLLKVDAGWSAPKIAQALDVSVGTVYRIKRLFVAGGLERALNEWPRPPRPHQRRLDEKGEAHLIALACSPAPEGHDHWTLRLLAGKVVELGLTESISHESIRRRLKKTRSNPGRSKSGAFPR